MLIHTPLDQKRGESGQQLGGLSEGWLLGVLAAETGVGATRFCQAVCDQHDATSAWFDLSGNPGRADVLVDAAGFTVTEVLWAAERLTRAVGLMVFDSVICWPERSITQFLRELQAMCIESETVSVVVGMASNLGGHCAPVGGRAWQNHCDLLVELDRGQQARIIWWAEDAPTMEWFQWEPARKGT